MKIVITIVVLILFFSVIPSKGAEENYYCALFPNNDDILWRKKDFDLNNLKVGNKKDGYFFIKNAYFIREFSSNDYLTEYYPVRHKITFGQWCRKNYAITPDIDEPNFDEFIN